MRILILDADPLVLMALADTVRRRLPGVEANTASSLHAGLKKLAHTGYDAILSDARLPDAPGVAAISVLRQRHPDIPIILMSVELGKDLMAYATLSGVYLFLHKPVEPNVLMAMLNRVIEHTSAGRQIDELTQKVNRHTKRARKVIAHARLMLEAKDRLLGRRQEALATSEHMREQLAKTLSAFPQGVVALDRSWRIGWLNELVPPVFRLKLQDDLVGKGLWEACPDLADSDFERECRRAVCEQRPVHFKAHFPGEDQPYGVDAVPHKDGLSIFISEGRQPDDAAYRPHDAAASSDLPHSLSTISGDHKEAAGNDADNLQSTGHRGDLSGTCLTQQVQATREAERARIARDLHGDLGQLLTALQLDLAWLETRLPQEQLPALLKVRFMTHLVNRITDSVHRICNELQPEILDDLGLVGAIQWQASAFEHRTGLRCIVSMKDVDRLDAKLSTELFRVVQELLTHVARHAKATVIWVTLKKETGSFIVLEVVDNGRRSTESDTTPTSSYLNLRERVMLLGGHLAINGIPGQGTTVTVKIPCTDVAE